MKSRNKFVKILLLLLAAVMMMSFVGCNDVEKEDTDNGKNSSETSKSTKDPCGTENSTSTSTPESEPTPTHGGNSITDANVGETIKFGHYEQDNNTSNGKEEIEWIVLTKEGNKVLVTSKYALAAKPYNDTYTDVTWETCTLRTWLNITFLNDAFSSTEQSKIANTTVVNNDNPKYDTEGGNNTQDKVFLLSIDEANTYFSSDEARELQGTAYAKANNLWTYTDSGYPEYYDNCWWWLRSPGNLSGHAAGVYYGGSVVDGGNTVGSSNCGIRPALWINI